MDYAGIEPVLAVCPVFGRAAFTYLNSLLCRQVLLLVTSTFAVCGRMVRVLITLSPKTLQLRLAQVASALTGVQCGGSSKVLSELGSNSET